MIEITPQIVNDCFEKLENNLVKEFFNKNPGVLEDVIRNLAPAFVVVRNTSSLQLMAKAYALIGKTATDVIDSLHSFISNKYPLIDRSEITDLIIDDINMIIRYSSDTSYRD